MAVTFRSKCLKPFELFPLGSAAVADKRQSIIWPCLSYVRQIRLTAGVCLQTCREKLVTCICKHVYKLLLYSRYRQRYREGFEERQHQREPHLLSSFAFKPDLPINPFVFRCMDAPNDTINQLGERQRRGSTSGSRT